MLRSIPVYHTMARTEKLTPKDMSVRENLTSAAKNGTRANQIRKLSEYGGKENTRIAPDNAESRAPGSIPAAGCAGFFKLFRMLLNLDKPFMFIFNIAVLYAGQGIVKLCNYRAGFFL